MRSKEKILENKDVLEKADQRYQLIKNYFKTDKYLKLEKYPEDVLHSDFGVKLSKYPNVSMYVIVHMSEGVNLKNLNALRAGGWTLIGSSKEFMGKPLAVFYGQYRFIRNLENKPYIRGVYIMKQFGASGHYNLGFTMKGQPSVIDVNFKLPKNKPAERLVSRSVELLGSGSEIKIEGDTAKTTLKAVNNKRVTLRTQLEYVLNLESLLDSEVKVVGYDMTLAEYKKRLAGYPVNKMFLSTADKIVFSDYIDELARKVAKPDKTIAEIWDEITKTLNRDIRYDYKKRKDFFSGQKTYYDIRDMYLSAASLGEAKVGACPERSSLEVAILRRIGIPARTSTRLYHIYAEILWPGNGWVSTSGLLHEIPLVESEDENQSYFVDWSPKYPVNLKWQGSLRPDII